MNNRSEFHIQQLVEDLQPRAPMKRWNGWALVLAALAATIAVVALGFGLARAGVSAPIYVLANGLMLVLGTAASLAVISMAMPRVGRRHDAPKWAMASVGLVPLAAIGAALSDGAGAAVVGANDHDLACLVLGSLFATITAGVLLYWLRRGAPVSPNRAGLYLGLASGAMGTFAYGLSCPVLSVGHVGIWHVLPILLWAVLGRLTVPIVIRW